MSHMMNPYKKQLEKAIDESIDSFGPKTRLRDAIEYSLKNGGKRFRPAIVYMVANALGKNHDIADAALAIEFFHTASLIADDLPCMDDDDHRRGHLSLHKAFDETTAILTTYALIAAGYDRIRLNAQKLGDDRLCVLALENATKNTGIHGATGGQYLDLFPNKDQVHEMIEKKTGTLFEISFVFGWLFGGGDVDQLDEVKEMAHHFGMAFQISDDFLDILEDRDAVNYPSIVGEEKALKTLIQELSKLKSSLKKLRIETPELLTLVELIEKRYAPTFALS